jgi:hypothetical protein
MVGNCPRSIWGICNNYRSVVVVVVVEIVEVVDWVVEPCQVVQDWEDEEEEKEGVQLRDGMKSGCFRRESMILMMYEGEGKRKERASSIIL